MIFPQPNFIATVPWSDAKAETPIADMQVLQQAMVRRGNPSALADLANTRRIAPRSKGYRNIRFATHRAIRQLLGK